MGHDDRRGESRLNVPGGGEIEAGLQRSRILTARGEEEGTAGDSMNLGMELRWVGEDGGPARGVVGTRWEVRWGLGLRTFQIE